MLSRRPAQAIGQGSGFSFACHQNRLVYGVGCGKYDVSVVSFESIGGAQQIDLAFFERLDRGLPGGEALNLDWQTGGFAKDTCVIGGKTFVVVATDGQVERGVVRG